MKEQIKNIIQEKRYFELTPNEKSMIKEWAANEEEFEALKITFLAVEELKSGQKEQLSPSIKESLNEKFAIKHTHQKETWLNKVVLFFFPKDVQFYKKPAFQLAMVALVVALVIPFLWQNDTPQYAMKEKEVKVDKFSEKQDEAQEIENVSEDNNEEVTNINENDKIKEEPVPPVKHEEEQPGHKIKSFESLEKPVQHPLEESKEKVATQIQKEVERDFSEQERPEVQSVDDLQMDFIQADGVGANQKSSKQVDAAETLDLLTVLY